MKTRNSVLGPVVLALALMTAGCGGDSDPVDGGKSPTAAVDDTSTTGVESVSPTETLSPLEQLEENAKVDAQATLAKYFRVLDQVGQDPKASLSRLKTVATGTLRIGQEDRFRKWREDGWVKTGAIKVTEMRVEDVSLDNSAPAKGKVPNVVITVCTDASGVDVVDRSGKSVVLDSRPEQLTTRYSLSNYSWESDKSGGWRVGSGEDQELGSCAL